MLEHLRNPQTIVVAMSGGVDSSVAAALLVEQGYQVIGIMLRLWSEEGQEADNRCCTPDAMALARRVAAKLGIPFYVLNAEEIFYQTVVRAFIDGYAQGITPNPCLTCNRLIRWEFLLDHALALGADFLATGHYARLRDFSPASPPPTLGEVEGAKAKTVQLLRAADESKDQSYVLHLLNQQQLRRALFPIGDYAKSQVRELARRFDLPVAERQESQDLCFLGNENYRDFLRRHAPQVVNPGPILDREGNPLGKHQGLAFFTIGQRKGLAIRAPTPLYVLEKDLQRNALIVGRREELSRLELIAGSLNWISGEAPSVPRRVRAKIRYTAPLVWGTLTSLSNGYAHFVFDVSPRDITPGQAAVFYEGEVVLGGGIIQPQSILSHPQSTI